MWGFSGQNKSNNLKKLFWLKALCLEMVDFFSFPALSKKLSVLWSKSNKELFFFFFCFSSLAIVIEKSKPWTMWAVVFL